MGRTEYKASTKNAGKQASFGDRQMAEKMPSVPKASTYAGTSPMKKANKKNPDAPAYVCICRVSTEAQNFLGDNGLCIFPGVETRGNHVYMVALAHPNAYPTIEFKILERFNEFLEAVNADKDGVPKNFKDLTEVCHVVAVTTGTFVPYNLPYGQWQRAFYIAGNVDNVRNFVMELDNYIVALVAKQATPKFGNFTLKVQIADGIDLRMLNEDFDYRPTEIELSAKKLFVSPLNMYPPQGVRPLILHLEVPSQLEVAMTFFGDTYRHRDSFRAFRLEFVKEENDSVDTDGASVWKNTSQDQERPSKFYIMKKTDVSIEENATFVKHLLTKVIDHAIVDVRLVSKPEPDSVSGQFIRSLKMFGNLIFREE